MKYLLLLCLLAGGLRAAGQVSPLPVDSLTHKVTYQGVVQVPGATQAELYSRAREWFAVTFGSAKAVLEMDDRTAGKLIGRENGGYMQHFLGQDTPVTVWRTVNIQVKDGRFKYVFTGFATGDIDALARPVELAMVPAAYDKNGALRPYMADMFAGIRKTAENQVASLLAAMTKTGAKSNW